jgi:hypothetical protein
VKILLYRGRSWFDRMIEWQSRGPYSHAAVLVNEGTHQIVEAVWPCVSARILDDRELPDWDVYSISGMSPIGEATAIAWLQLQRGKPYFVSDLMNFVTRRPVRDDADAKFICSMLAFEAAYRGGVQLLNRIKDWAVSPNLLGLSPLLNCIGKLTPLKS